MNRYPVWKYAIIVVALLVGLLYTLPNFFGEAPAVQVSAAKSTVKVDAAHAGARRAGAEGGRHHARPGDARRAPRCGRASTSTDTQLKAQGRASSRRWCRTRATRPTSSR